MLLVTVAAGFAVWASGQAEPAIGQGIAGGGGHTPPIEHISPAVRAEIDAAIEHYEKTIGPLSTRAPGTAPPKFPFYPVGGKLYGDLFTNNFVDLDPTAGILDWDCTDFTYNGHDASDVDLRTFGEQAIGVPIFAALDGTVIAARDGCDDMNTCPGSPCNPSCANYVVIDHGNGRVCYYYHMKKNSVAVLVGQEVRIGEQIGLVASSGNSSHAHLHFATYDDGVVVEPYAGPCRPGTSEWVNQTPIERSTYLRDFGITYGDMWSYPGYPYEFPRSGQIAITDGYISFWALPINLPANSTWRVRFQRPDTTIVYDSGEVGFGNPFYRWSWWYWIYDVSQDVPDMQSITGTWHLLFDLNGTRMVDAPFEVRTNRTPDFNHAPQLITVYLDPPDPTSDDAIFCRVITDLVLDDLDYDIVRYHYVWRVDGDIVRDVTTAGHADAISRCTAGPGSLVECTVTPSDGKDEGLPASDSASIPICPPCPPLAEPDAIAKIRYISMAPSNPGRQTALRVTLVSLPLPFSGSVGTKCWVGEPLQVSENAGKIPHQEGWPDFWSANLQGTPHCMDWSTVATLHVTDDDIIPGAVYDVQAIDCECELASEANYSLPLTIGTSRWGDLVKDCATCPCGPPDGTVGVPTDVTAALDKFKNLRPPSIPCDAVMKARADVEPNFPDWLVNISDVTFVLDAFRGCTFSNSPPFPFCSVWSGPGGCP